MLRPHKHIHTPGTPHRHIIHHAQSTLSARWTYNTNKVHPCKTNARINYPCGCVNPGCAAPPSTSPIMLCVYIYTSSQQHSWCFVCVCVCVMCAMINTQHTNVQQVIYIWFSQQHKKTRRIHPHRPRVSSICVKTI